MLNILIPELRNSINMDIPCSFFITWGELVDKLVVSAVHYLNKQIPAVIEAYILWTKTQECESLQTILLQPDKGGNQPDSQMCHPFPHPTPTPSYSCNLRDYKEMKKD